MRDQAVKLLPLIELPGFEASNLGRTLSSRASVSKSFANSRSSIKGGSIASRKVNDDAVEVCLEVGKALKKVDRGLFQEWFKWCNGVISFNSAIALWDCFAPMACDVHCATYSQIRDTFQKLLRPGVDYVTAFESYVEKLSKRAAAAAEAKDVDLDFDHNQVSLNKIEMKRFLRSLGFDMKSTELRALVDAFDANGDGSISVTEFKDFVGRKRERKGGVSTILGQKCCWQTTCRTTGMANAYSVSIKPRNDRAEEKGATRADTYDEKEEDNYIAAEGAGKTEIQLKSGETRIVVELKERLRREDVLRRYNMLSSSTTKAESKGDEEDDYGDEFETTEAADAKSGVGVMTDLCPYIAWTLDDRKAGLKYLMNVTKESRQEQLIKNLINNGTPPLPPKFWCASHTDPYFRGDENAMTSELLLRWGPDQQADLVSFYSLEFAGAVGGTPAKALEYREIFRDPVDASPESNFELSTLVDKLEPGKAYYFRIRGFNGFGPGDFCYKEFCTRPGAPAVPRVIKCSSGAVTLRWTFSPSFFKCLEELRRVFNLADADKTGTVERDELAAVLQEKYDSSNTIATFLRKVQASAEVSFVDGFDALFDLIESDDDGHLSWEEFEKFFLSVGWSGNTNGSISGSRSMNIASKATSDGITYIVEQCSSEFSDTYEEILKTTSGECTIHRLEPGHSYRFRVFALNMNGLAGPKSENIVVNTMLETPAAPSVSSSNSSSIGARSVTLTWKPRNAFLSTRDSKVQKKMMGEWSGSGGDSEEGVSVELAFQEYDRDGNGTIDASELALLLQDLGVEANEERLRHAFEEFDRNGDGVISFEEFSDWWKKDEVVYVLKRSDPIVNSIDNDTKSANTKSFASVSVPFVSYRGKHSYLRMHVCFLHMT